MVEEKKEQEEIEEKTFKKEEDQSESIAEDETEHLPETSPLEVQKKTKT